MRIAKCFIWFLLILLFGGCAGIQVSQDYEPGSDFSDLKSFKWKSETQPKTGDYQVDNPLLDNRIRRAIDLKLANMGYRKVAQGPHDFNVGYSYNVRSTLDSSSVSVGTGFGIGGDSSFGGIGIGFPVGGRSSDEGLLVIDFTDPLTGKLLWRGTGTSRLIGDSTPEKITSDINMLVEKILAQFPISPKM